MPKRPASLLQSECSLRERKYAKTKNIILDIFTEKLKKQLIEEVSIKDICIEAQISEGTFYNYFPKKTDILVLFIAQWSIKARWLADKKFAETGSGLRAIDEIFAFTADEMQRRGPVMFEVISFLSRMRTTPPVEDISMAEKLVAFPDMMGIEKVKAQNLVDMAKFFLDKAIANRELPKNVNMEKLQLGIRTIFFGAPLALTQAHVKKVGFVYQNSMDMLWSSI